MKKLNERYFTIAVYALVAFLLLFLFGMFCFNLSPIFNGLSAMMRQLSAIVYAVILALILLPIVRLTEVFFQWLFRKKEKKERLVKVLSLIVSYLLIFLLLCAIVLSAVPSFTGNQENLQKMVSNVLPTFRQWLSDDMLIYTTGQAVVGGLVGESTGSIRGAYAAESIQVYSIQSALAGGLIGRVSGMVQGTFATKEVAVKSNNTAYVGGLFGLILTEGEDASPLANQLERNYRYSGQLISADAPNSTETPDGLPAVLGTLQSSTFLTDVMGGKLYDGKTEDAFWVCREDAFPTLHFLRKTSSERSEWNGQRIPLSAGSGTEDDPYRIRSAAELAYLAEYVNAGGETQDTFYLLDADLSFANHSWTPIGVTEETPFRGTFLGNGHSIIGLSAHPGSTVFGIFGYNEGVIQDLFIQGLDVRIAQASQITVGAVAAHNSGTIRRCQVAGSVSVIAAMSGVDVGTLTGINTGTISACAVSGELTVVAADCSAGGLCGINRGEIEQSYATRDVEKNLALNFIGETFLILLTNTVFSTETVANLATRLTSSIFSVVSVALMEIANFVLGIMISVYILLSRKQLAGIFGKLLFAIFPKKAAIGIGNTLRRLYNNLCEFFSSRFFLAFAAGAAAFLVCWLFQFPLFSLWAILFLVAHFFPIIGPILAVAALSLLLLILRGPETAFLFALIMIGVEFLLSKVLTPILVRKNLRPSFGVRVTVVLVGGGFFGGLGILFALPVYATLQIDAEKLIAHLLHRKQLPADPEFYESVDMTKAPFAAEDTQTPLTGAESPAPETEMQEGSASTSPPQEPPAAQQEKPPTDDHT